MIDATGRTVPVLGVDFSGARGDNATWVTQGLLLENTLTIQSCRPVTRSQLADLLSSAPGNAVAALDFPFSVPREFVSHWLPGTDAMPPLWSAAAAMEFEEFLALRDEFVAKSGEPLRRGDLYFPECYSCLHKTNPNMVPMTFRGMQMLHRLWQEGCRVPPLDDDGQGGPLLLESMPGAALRALGLPFKGYKGGRNNLELRKQVLDGIEPASGLAIPNLDDFRLECTSNHDCLDSLAAAVTACLWVKDESLFRLPQDGPGTGERRGIVPDPAENELETARLEGWLYAPVFIPPRE